MLDRDGNRINRRNPQDIFTPLYDHQIPPGAAQVVHYLLQVPEDAKAPIELEAKLRYRKFDHEYMSLVHGSPGKVPPLPIVDICEDRLLLPVAGFTGLVNAQNGYLDEAIANFEQILDPQNQPRNRKFDFTRDYVVSNELAATLFKRAQQEDEPAERARFLRQAVERYQSTLQVDPEDLDAHYGLAQCYSRLGDVEDSGTTNASSPLP